MTLRSGGPVALLLLLLLLVLSLSGCGIHFQSTALNPSPRVMKPKRPEDVHLFTSGRPSQPYHEVLLLQAEEESAYADYEESEVLTVMRKRAGELGCDALMVLSSTGNVASTGAGRYNTTRTLRGFRATCVVYAAPTNTLAVTTTNATTK
jgi:hypothetical protein